MAVNTVVNNGLMILYGPPRIFFADSPEVLGTCAHCMNVIEDEVAIAIPAPTPVLPDDPDEIDAYLESYNAQYPNGVVCYHISCVADILRQRHQGRIPGLKAQR